MQKEEDDPTLEKNLRVEEEVAAPSQFDMIQLPTASDSIKVNIRHSTAVDTTATAKGTRCYDWPDLVLLHGCVVDVMRAHSHPTLACSLQ